MRKCAPPVTPLPVLSQSQALQWQTFTTLIREEKFIIMHLQT